MLQPASKALRWLYCLSIVSMIFPVATSGWVNIALGRGPSSKLQLVLWIALTLVGLWRISRVAAAANTLESYVYGSALKVARIIGIVGMVFSVVFLVVRFAYRPIVHMLFPHPTEDGVEYFVVGLYIALFAGLAPIGLYLFEFTRLLGFERHHRGDG